MLQETQRERVYQRGIAMLHDVHLCSSIYGEPFLGEAGLFYFDSELLTYCGFPLLDQSSSPASQEQELRQAVALLHPKGVLYLGPHHLATSLLWQSSLYPIVSRRHSTLSAELFVSCNSALRRKAYGNACARRLTVKWGLASEIGNSHFRIMANALRSRNDAAHTRDVLMRLPFFIGSSCEVITVLEKGEVCGFGLCRKALRNATAFHYVFHDGAGGIVDVIIRALIDDAMTSDVPAINLGSCCTEGQRSFKIKWGAEPWVPTLVTVLWAHPSFRFVGDVTLGGRLLAP